MTSTPFSYLFAIRPPQGWAILFAIMLANYLPLAAQSLPAAIQGEWRVLNAEAVSLDQNRIELGRGAQYETAPVGKGRFAHSAIAIGATSADFIFTAGRIGDSTATSGQSYWPVPSSFHPLSPTHNIVRFETEGCPEYSLTSAPNQLILDRFNSQTIQLHFEPGTAAFTDAEYVSAVIENLNTHFECKQFDRLLVTIRTARSEYSAQETARLHQLKLDRVALIKALFAKDSIVDRLALQIETNLAYVAAEPTVTFEFHKIEGWLANDSLPFKILPASGTQSAHIVDAATATHIAQIPLSEAQKSELRTWEMRDWLLHLENPTSDFATNLILYAATEKDIPAWLQTGAMEWKLFGKANDLVKWKAFLEKGLPKL